MKKSIISIILTLACTSMFAQNLGDALTFGANDYIGTARSLGMGGAMNAVGCDLGSIGINPAGSAVAGYSQFVVSPGLSLSGSATSFILDPYSSPAGNFKNTRTRFKLPNIGYTMRMSGGDWAQSITFGFVLNSTYDFNYNHYGEGLNASSSKFAEMARAADGISNSVLGSDKFYNDELSNNLWDVKLGYDLGLIGAYGDANEGHYVGCTESLADDGSRYVPGNLIQRSKIITEGSKNDILLNMAFNFSNNFYLGFNMGIPCFTYSTSERFSEIAQTAEDFPVRFTYEDGTIENTFFSDATYQYNYTASGVGLYGKIGAIWLPFAGLRLGAAVQTPTVMGIDEAWVHSGSVSYVDKGVVSGRGEQGYYSYDYVTPWQADFGVAYTFGKVGLLSVDYTMLNYSTARFSDDYGSDFDFTNSCMREFAGISHNLRVGLEFNVVPDFSVRAGYGFTTSAEKYYTDGVNNYYYTDYDEDYYLGRKQLPLESKYVPDLRQSVSLGFGYNPAGSFFADFAVRYTSLPSSVYQPYYDYDDLYSPVFETRRSLINAVLTLGWRF